MTTWLLAGALTCLAIALIIVVIGNYYDLN